MPNPHAISLKVIQDEDLNEIMQIDRIIFPNEIPWSKEFFQYNLGRNISFLAMDDQSNICGYIFAKRQYDGFLISNFGVLPDKQRLGIGTQLMEMVLTTLSQQGDTDVHLQVRKTNGVALRFYQKYGFEIESEDDEWYQMTLKLTPKVVQQDNPRQTQPSASTNQVLISSQFMFGMFTAGLSVVGLSLLVASIVISSPTLAIVSAGALLTVGLFCTLNTPYHSEEDARTTTSLYRF